MKTTFDKIVIDQKGRIFLRELSVDEVTPVYLEWMKDKEVIQYLESRFYPQTMGSIYEFVDDCAKDPDTLFLAVRESGTGKHIGNIKLHRIDRRHNSGEVSVLIGDKNFWGRALPPRPLSCYPFIPLMSWGFTN
jgi:ribosomal-protein-alanine N-acetyltransferase